MNTFTPRGWKPGLIEKRFANATPTSYDADSGTVDCILASSAPVARFYGTEVLKISPSAVIIDRLVGGGIPLLDSHQQTGINNSLGKFTRIWFSGGSLMGKIAFNATAEGRKAEGMVKRREIAGISAGYSVREWEISDEDGRIIDPEATNIRWDDTGLTFTATLWELLEGSLVTVPADANASVRSMRGGVRHQDLSDVRTRMAARNRIATRQRMHDAQQAVIGNSDE